MASGRSPGLLVRDVVGPVGNVFGRSELIGTTWLLGMPTTLAEFRYQG
ncbi:MAG: hypothetical protein ACLQGP_36825 [Isosphaeraceae bacterium]